MPKRIVKTVLSPVSLVTITGLVKPTEWDIPEFLQSDIEDGDPGCIFITLKDGTTVPIDRSGINFGLPAKKMDEIKSILLDQMGFRFIDETVYEVLEGSGRYSKDYSPADGKEISRFIRSYPELSSRLFTAFNQDSPTVKR